MEIHLDFVIGRLVLRLPASCFRSAVMKHLFNRRTLLLSLDLGVIVLAYMIGFYFRHGRFGLPTHQSAFLYLSLVVFPTFFYVFDLYYPFRRFMPAQTFIDVLFSVLLGMVMTAALAYADRSFTQSRLGFVYSSLLLIFFVFVIRLLDESVSYSRLLDKKILILGAGPLALEIARVIRETPHSGMEVAGLVSNRRDNGKSKTLVKNGLRILGNVSEMVSLIDWYKARLVVLALEPDEETSDLKIYAELLERNVPVTSSIHLFEKLSGDVPYKLLGAHYLLGLMAQVKTRPYLKLKRLIDLFFGAWLLVLLSPVLAFAVAVLAFSGPREILFLQKRIGKDSVPFQLIKLRTMTTTRRGKEKVTRLGSWMRKYRIDEIPQLLNVLKGEMSLIGPRPEIPYFVDRCRKKIPFYSTVFTVKPGLTGWAQVKFRHATSVGDYEKKFRYNLYYLKNISLALDLLIILKTIRVVLMGKGK